MNHIYKSISRKIKKIEKAWKQQNKKSQPTSHRRKPLYYQGNTFFWLNMHICVNRGSNRLPQASHVSSSLPHYTTIWLYKICFSFILTLKSICWGRMMSSPTPLFYFKILFKSLNTAEQIKKWKTSTLWLLCTIDIEKYMLYILVYINVKIVET